MIAGALLVALEYTAPAACPRQEQFWESVVHAAPDLERATEGAVARSYRVVIEPAPGSFRGELSELGQPAPRVLQAADCGELAEALALMLVLSTEREPRAVAATPATAAATLAEWPASTPVSASAAGPAPAPAPVARRPPLDSVAPVEPPLATKNTAAMLGALVWLGAGPDPLLGIAVGIQHALGPVIVARVEARVALASARADATYVGLAPQVCARALALGVTGAACLGSAIGALQVKAVEYSGGKQSSAWLAPLLGVHADVSLAEPLLLELSIEGEHGFIERDYHIKSDDSQFTTPPFSLLSMVALGASF